MSLRPSELAALAVASALGLALPPRVCRGAPVFEVIDLHVDLPWQLHLKGRSVDLDAGHYTRKAMVDGHVAGVVLPLYLPDGLNKTGPTEADLEAMVKTVERLVWNPLVPFSVVPVGEAGKRPAQVQAWLSFEGAQALSGKPAAMSRWVARGVKLVGLAHAHDNDLAGSATGKARKGLTAAGKALAQQALDEGALLDVSHLSDASIDDVLALSSKSGSPVVASHSNARVVCDHPRNLSDRHLKAIAASGGVVGLNLHAPYLSSKPDPRMAQVLAQLDHLIGVAGEDAVAIGSDFDGGITPPVDLPGPGAFGALAAAMQAHGYSEARVRKVFSANARRVLGFTSERRAR